MKKKNTYYFDLNYATNSHESVLSECRKLLNHYLKYPETKLLLDFSNCYFIYPDYAVMILCALKHLENMSIEVPGKIRYRKNPDVISYLSRMNFFKHLNIDNPIEFSHYKSSRFVKIQYYNEDNQLEVLHAILSIIRNNSSINEEVYVGLDYCLNEILDNVLNHSTVKKGWVVAQYFEKLNSIRLIVCDNGIGIHASLEDRYNFSEEQAIMNCIVDGITNGLGQGHGLYATATFAKLNRGWLSIMSGNKKMDVSHELTSIKSIAYWQGTCVYLRVNTDISVDYKKFTSNHFDYKLQLYEDMFG